MESGAFQFHPKKIFSQWGVTVSFLLHFFHLPSLFISSFLYFTHFPPQSLPLSSASYLLSKLPLHFSIPFPLLSPPPSWTTKMGMCGEQEGKRRGGDTACVTKPPIKFPQPIILHPPLLLSPLSCGHCPPSTNNNFPSITLIFIHKCYYYYYHYSSILLFFFYIISFLSFHSFPIHTWNLNTYWVVHTLPGISGIHDIGSLV